jgi:archaellum component FlaC
MDTVTRAAIAALGDTMSRYFELQQAQFVEWRDEVRGEFAEMRGEFTGLRNQVSKLRDRVDALTERVARLEHEVGLFRDYVTREIAEIRLELRELLSQSGQTDELRREVAELAVRVERLERRQPD